MPFTPEPNLPDDPAVRIFFSGLLILEPSAEGETCEVFVHRSAPNHHLTIELRRKTVGKPDVILMRHVGPLTFGETLSDDPLKPPIHGFVIHKVTDGATGVRMYNGNVPSYEGRTLNLAINLESPQYHGGNPPVVIDPETGHTISRLLDVDSLGGRPSILLDDGTFYTADTTREALGIVLKKIGSADQPLLPFASLIGANIYLEDDDSTVTVSWRNLGKFEVLELTKPAANESYEIYIVNDPLYENPSLSEPKHDEFREYYKILPHVPTPDQFRLDWTPDDERGSTSSPCMPIIKGGG